MKNTSHWPVAIGALACMPLLAFGAPDEIQIHIDATASGVPVNQKIFGQFIKGADNYGVFSIPHPDLAAIREGDGIWNPDAKAPFSDAWEILKSYRPGALRYPDGLPIHNHDWKKTIGPASERGDRLFGLNEFMQLNEELKSEAIFVVSEYIGTPQDAADLVEYLNMPATAEHPWAMRRAADGHPEPYRVRYFEMGNESWVDWRKHGKPEVRSPEEVGRYASEVAAAMKRVDPLIHCGIPLERKDDDRWNHGVLKAITPSIDFAIIHIYPVKYGGGDMEGFKENLLLEAMMAAGYTTSLDLVRLRAEITEIAGRDLPLALTEYNMGPTQQTPGLQRPYRFTLAAALGTGDYLGRLLDPKQGIESAIYWSWLNGTFGTVNTYAGHPWKTREKLAIPQLRPAHYIFQLWARYRGERLLPVRSDAPRLDFPGITTIMPMIGEVAHAEEKISEANVIEGARILTQEPSRTTLDRAPDGEWSIRFDGSTGGAYPNMLIRQLGDLPEVIRPPAPGLLYKVTFEALWKPDSGTAAPNLGVGIMDSRGWKKSGSAIAIRGLQAATDWMKFDGTYQPLPDTQSIVVLARVESGTTPLHGTLKIRALRVTPWRSATYPARPALSAYATRSEDGRKLHVIVFNLTLDRDLPATLSWDGFNAGKASYSELNGTSAAAVNQKGAIAGWAVENKPLPLRSAGNVEHVFPSHSATGITLEAVSPRIH